MIRKERARKQARKHLEFILENGPSRITARVLRYLATISSLVVSLRASRIR